MVLLLLLSGYLNVCTTEDQLSTLLNSPLQTAGNAETVKIPFFMQIICDYIVQSSKIEVILGPALPVNINSNK